MQAERKSEELNKSTAFDNKLRPTDFEGFVGQDKVRDRMLLAVKAAKERGEPLDHVLFSGPPGLGKTTLSYILGEAMGVNVKTTSGPVITKPGTSSSSTKSTAWRRPSKSTCTPRWRTTR